MSIFVSIASIVFICMAIRIASGKGKLLLGGALAGSLLVPGFVGTPAVVAGCFAGRVLLGIGCLMFLKLEKAI